MRSEKSIAFASLPVALAEPGTQLAIRVFDRVVPTEVVTAPLYDPSGARLR